MPIQTATNPKTGERVALVGDSWQPIVESATNKEGIKAYLVGDKWLTDTPIAETPAPKRQNVGAEKGNMFTQGVEDMQYDPMSGLPLNTAGYGPSPTGATGVAAKALTTMAGVPINYAMGAASIPLNVANLASKVTGVGQPATTMSSMITGQKPLSMTEQALQAKNQIVQGVNQQSYAPVTKTAEFAGEVFNPVTMAVPGALGNAVTKISSVNPALAKFAAPIAESLASGGFKTGIVPTNALQKILNLSVQGAGGAGTGVVTNMLISPEQSNTVAGAIGAAVPIAVPPVAKGIAIAAGKVWDLATNQAAKVEAGKIARKMAGDTINEIRAANGIAPMDIDAAQAAYGIQNDVWQAFLDVVKGKDTKAVFSTLKTKQAQDQFNVLANMARGATEAEAKTSREVANKTLNNLTTRPREENMLNANLGKEVMVPLQQKADLARQAAAANVEKVRRLSTPQVTIEPLNITPKLIDNAGVTAPGVQARAINPAPTNLATDANLTNLANRADEAANKAAAESLTQGEIARNAEAKLADLTAKGLQPLDVNVITKKLNEFANQVGTRVDPVQVSVLNNLNQQIKNAAKTGGGIMDVNDLYQIRKTGVNDAIEKELRSNGLDPSTQSTRIASMLTQIRPLIDDAIEKAGGKTWRDYLATHSAGLKQIEQMEMADKLRSLYKTDKNTFVKLVEGNDIKAVQDIFGPSNHDIAVQMSEKIKPLLKIKDEITRDAKINEQINIARRALGFKENSWAEKIPGFVGLETAVAKKLIQTIEGKINDKAMQVLIKGAESGKNMNEILNTLPASERTKFLSVLNDSKEWSPLVGTAVNRATNRNKLAPEQPNQNALAR
jgi:hypothetical protein